MSRSIVVLIGVSTVFAPRLAEACGCLAPPTPAQPVIQAGERIVFGVEDGRVVAHVQIQYEGDAEDFAWVVPLPSVPEVELGTAQLFDILDDATRPTYVLDAVGTCGGGGPELGCGCSDDSVVTTLYDPFETDDPAVITHAATGPYEYDVVRADDGAQLATWLSDNGYFVPSLTSDVLEPYVREGAYFLALKLRAGTTSRDIQPVVLRYESDTPMVPLVLTSVAAVEDMGVLVYVLGEHRAVPRNFQHVTINEAHIDWLADASNYAEVVGRAVDETDGHHAFVTEYAGPFRPSTRNRFRPAVVGAKMDVAAADAPRAFVDALYAANVPVVPLRPILQRAFEIPDCEFVTGDAPVDEVDDIYMSAYARNADAWDGPFDSIALADEIWTRVVVPAEQTYAFIEDKPYVTRMFTTLDPDEMTADPAFSFNPDLPPVSNEHSATWVRGCDEEGSGTLELSDGRAYDVSPRERAVAASDDAPYAMTIEALGLEGAPRLLVDNRPVLEGGCTGVHGRTRGSWVGWGLMLAMLISLRDRSGRRRR